MLQKGEKYEENKVNFEGAYLGNSLADSAQIWNWRCPTPREFTQKFRVLLFRECGATDAWKRRSLYSCKVRTCLLRPRVSWAAWHTTVCLDFMVLLNFSFYWNGERQCIAITQGCRHANSYWLSPMNKLSVLSYASSLELEYVQSWLLDWRIFEVHMMNGSKWCRQNMI